MAYNFFYFVTSPFLIKENCFCNGDWTDDDFYLFRFGFGFFAIAFALSVVLSTQLFTPVTYVYIFNMILFYLRFNWLR